MQMTGNVESVCPGDSVQIRLVSDTQFLTRRLVWQLLPVTGIITCFTPPTISKDEIQKPRFRDGFEPPKLVSRETMSV
jgi:hypothetical protein